LNKNKHLRGFWHKFKLQGLLETGNYTQRLKGNFPKNICQYELKRHNSNQSNSEVETNSFLIGHEDKENVFCQKEVEFFLKLTFCHVVLS